MSFYKDGSQWVDALAVGRTGTNFPVTDVRDPNITDLNYPIGKFWINTATEVVWYLNNFTQSNGIVEANWVQLPAGSSSVTSIEGDDNVVVMPTAGVILLHGNTVANGTHATAVFTQNSGPSNQENIDVQVATAAGVANIAEVGLASFFDNDFSVDVNGFVTLNNQFFVGTATTIGPSSADINFPIPVPLSSAVVVTAEIVGIGTDFTAAGGFIVGLAVNNAGVVTIQGVPDLTRNNNPVNDDWNANLVVSGTDVFVRVTGVSHLLKVINWKATISFTTVP